jgi:hypothetical protein
MRFHLQKNLILISFRFFGHPAVGAAPKPPDKPGNHQNQQQPNYNRD